MTQEERLNFCRKCLNRKMDMQQGLICNLTQEKAAFQDECSGFKIDETVKERPLNDKEGLQPSEIKQRLSQDTIERLRMEQKLIPGIVSGLVVGLVGALLWAAISVLTQYQIGYMAIAIGAGVGFAIRKMGKGIDQIFGISGAVISLLSVLLGNFLSIIGFFANYTGLGYIETLSNFNYILAISEYNSVFELMKASFQPMDLLFYALAIYAGYKFSFRKITEKKITELE